MLTVALGLGGAITYGFADFLGGLGSRRTPAIVVTGLTASIGLVPLLVGLAILGGSFTPAGILVGLAAGLCGSVAVLLLYASLAVGPMSVLSPVTAVFAAILPVVVGAFRGISLSPLAIVALVVAIAAVVMVAAVRDESGARLTARGLIAAIAAGCGFGGIVLAYDATTPAEGVAPLVIARLLQAVLLGGAAVVTVLRCRKKTRVSPDARRLQGSRFTWVVIGCGVCDAGANVLIQAALHSSSDPTTLPVVSVLNALYPIGTIVLAAIVLRERLTRLQTVGIGLAVAASVGLSLA
jgi:drug/metabolite transporter (DMT)-like permease